MQARGGVPTTPAWVVLLAEEESQLQATSLSARLITSKGHACDSLVLRELHKLSFSEGSFLVCVQCVHI